MTHDSPSPQSISSRDSHPVQALQVAVQVGVQVGGGRASIGDVAPALAALTDDVLFAEVWNRQGLSARDRSLVTVSVLVAGGDLDQLRFHLGRARENGVSEDELVEAVTHLAFYAGWPKAMSAVAVLREVMAA